MLTPSQSYIKISKQFLRVNKLSASVCAKVCGKYLEISSSSVPSLAGITMSRLISTVFKPLIKGEAAIKLTADQYEGQAAWSGQDDAGSIYIARGGSPYLLAVSQSGNYLSFSGWNTTTVSEPPASKVITAAQLGALAAG